LNNFIVTPTGDYDAGDLANTGLNYWTFEVDVAATYLNEDTGRTTLSWLVMATILKVKIRITNRATRFISTSGAGQGAGKTVLAGSRLRSGDSIHDPHRPEEKCALVHAGLKEKCRRLGRALFRSGTAGRCEREELDQDQTRRGLVHTSPSLWATGNIFRSELGIAQY